MKGIFSPPTDMPAVTKYVVRKSMICWRNSMGRGLLGVTCGRSFCRSGHRAGQTTSATAGEQPEPSQGSRQPPGTPHAYPTAVIISKIGRYMATIIPPTTTPSTTIMTGSTIAITASSAVSTSCS